MKNPFDSITVDGTISNKIDFERVDDVINEILEGLTIDNPILKLETELLAKSLILYLFEFHRERLCIYNLFRLTSLGIDEINKLFMSHTAGNVGKRWSAIYAVSCDVDNDIKAKALFLLEGQLVKKYIPIFERQVNASIDFFDETNVSDTMPPQNNHPDNKKKQQNQKNNKQQINNTPTNIPTETVPINIQNTATEPINQSVITEQIPQVPQNNINNQIIDNNVEIDFDEDDDISLGPITSQTTQTNNTQNNFNNQQLVDEQLSNLQNSILQQSDSPQHSEPPVNNGNNGGRRRGNVAGFSVN